MSDPQTRSPWLGGPGARWAQALLFLLHVALLVALAVCVRTFLVVLPRLDFEPWQTVSFLVGSAASLLFFGWRTLRIGRDLWRARPGAPGPPSAAGDGGE